VYVFDGRVLLSNSELMVWVDSIRFSSSTRHNLLSMAFSKILLITGSKLIGLYELTSSGNLPGFGIIMICTTFHWARKYPVQIIGLHTVVRKTMPFLGISFNILPVIKS
jgi:hypothetical protein